MLARHSGATRQRRTRNLEIPGLVLTHHPGMTGSAIKGAARRREKTINNP
jgi:hypothetical protein